MSFKSVLLQLRNTGIVLLVSSGLIIGQIGAADEKPAEKPEKAEKAEPPVKPESTEKAGKAEPPAKAESTEKAGKAEPAAKAEKTEKGEKGPEGKRKKRVIKLAEDKEETAPPEKDPATYELSNKKFLEGYTVLDRQPWDRGEHILISALMGAIGGGIVGGMVGFSGYDKNDDTKTLNSLYAFAGAGAGLGVVGGLTTTFFERGRVEQFAIGKFLLKYSWYGAIGGALIGGGIGMIPYASSGDYGDIVRYAGYGAGVGLAAGLALFFIDLPDHMKLYSYRREDQSVIMIAWRF